MMNMEKHKFIDYIIYLLGTEIVNYNINTTKSEIDEFCEMEWARQVRILTEQDVLLNDYLVKLDL